MAFIKNEAGSLVINAEYVGEGYELVPAVGYIVCKIIDEQIHYFGAESELTELVLTFGGTEEEADKVGYLKTNVGPVFLDGEEL